MDIALKTCLLVSILLGFFTLGTAEYLTDIPEGKESFKNATKQRQGKVFSLFNIVHFKNDGCSSTSLISSGVTRNGTCFTASECQSKGGSASGGCAAGFGVCCVFIISGANGGTITQNCTYIRNPGFPSVYSGTSGLTYTVNKFCPNVCFLRLDFESFTINGFSQPFDVATAPVGMLPPILCTDMFTILHNPATTLPVICGQNSGQHIYTDFGAQGSDSTTLNFAFTGTSANRQWDIKVTQVPCGGQSTPPAGCLQYQTGLTGRLTTFNFIPTNSHHLPNQDYSICIRQETGYCCIQYTPCSDPSSFSFLGAISATITAGHDNFCSTFDYISIPDSGNTCSTSSTGFPLTNRYCGSVLNAVAGTLGPVPICSCHQPFMVGIYTESTADTIVAAVPPLASRGICLNWMQIPCST